MTCVLNCCTLHLWMLWGSTFSWPYMRLIPVYQLGWRFSFKRNMWVPYTHHLNGITLTQNAHKSPNHARQTTAKQISGSEDNQLPRLFHIRSHIWHPSCSWSLPARQNINYSSHATLWEPLINQSTQSTQAHSEATHWFPLWPCDQPASPAYDFPHCWILFPTWDACM